MTVNRIIVGFLGKLIILVGLSMCVPLGMSIYDHEHLQKVYLIAIVITLVCGVLCMVIGFNHRGMMRIRDGFLLVTLAWLCASFFGSLPMMLSGCFPGYTDAFFETLSGFTATGITVLPEVESLPRSILLWRSMTQWLGGLGIVVLFVAMLSGVGAGTNLLLNAEVTGPVKEKLSPRSSDTAKILWIIYVILTVLNALCLLACGMGVFDATNHALATVSTGGYSTRNDGLLAFHESVQWVTLTFMFLASCSFALYYRFFKRRDINILIKNGEWRFYVEMVVFFTAIMRFELYHEELYSLGDAFRVALFNVIALFSSTAFMIADYDTWPPFLHIIIFMIMFIGGCAGSTAGGVKIERVMILLRQTKNELRNILHPRMITSLKINGSVVHSRVIVNVAIYIFLFVVIICVSTLFGAALGLPVLEAWTTSMSCLCNSGPSLGAYGPTECFAPLPSIIKWYYCILMLIGRLELYSVLVLFVPKNVKY